MTTERRESPRVPVTLDVVLNHHANSVICTTRDISVGGAFIEAERDMLPHGGTVELGLSLPASRDQQYVRLPAVIQRVTDEGAAVTFGDVGRDVYFQLVDFMAPVK
ncbi:MAG: PilZ domain-containing protein [Gammaproteobacteria bacterium]|nr:PilZ domain-containing protein [Gammaproteobacteria bacterium]